MLLTKWNIHYVRKWVCTHTRSETHTQSIKKNGHGYKSSMEIGLIMDGAVKCGDEMMIARQPKNKLKHYSSEPISILMQIWWVSTLIEERWLSTQGFLKCNQTWSILRFQGPLRSENIFLKCGFNTLRWAWCTGKLQTPIYFGAPRGLCIRLRLECQFFREYRFNKTNKKKLVAYIQNSLFSGKVFFRLIYSFNSYVVGQ